jgi:protein-tyrosine phosphatase
MAEFLLQDQLDKEEISDVEVESRGMMAQEGWSMPYEAQEALLKQEIEAGPHKARQLVADDVSGADLILVMEDWHLKDLVAEYPDAKGKTYLFKDYAGVGGGGVDDPYGASVETYKRLAGELRRAAAGVARRLKGGV